MTQTAAPKMTAVEKRFAFIREVGSPLEDVAKARLALQQSGLDADLVPDLDLDALIEIARKMADHGSELGRTARWKKTCMFAYSEITEAEKTGNLDQSFARWA